MMIQMTTAVATSHRVVMLAFGLTLVASCLLSSVATAFTIPMVTMVPTTASRSSSMTTLQQSVTTAEATSPTEITSPLATKTTTPHNNNNNNNNQNDPVVADDTIPLAPYTQWGTPYTDIVAVQTAAQAVELPEFGIEISALDVLHLSTTGGAEYDHDRHVLQQERDYFITHRTALLQQMQQHGCIVFRNFTLMSTPQGFTEFYTALQMQVCLDPLHSVSARPTIAVNGDNSNKKSNSPIYEAVNKESRKNFFIGMHNEFVGTRAPAAAAFVCFQNATQGGEFLIADGRRIFRSIPQDLLQLLYTKQIRYSVIR
jgi:Taurine catabolism dioxygenase TauD, TfdA family